MIDVDSRCLGGSRMTWGSPMRWISSVGSQKISKREKSWFGPESERYLDLFATIFTSKQKQTCYRWSSNISVSSGYLFHEIRRIFDFCLSASGGQNCRGTFWTGKAVKWSPTSEQTRFGYIVGAWEHFWMKFGMSHELVPPDCRHFCLPGPSI